VPPGTESAQTPGSNGDDDALLQALGADPVGLDALLARTGMDTAALQARLLQLELENRVGRLPGGLFQRIGLG
jgi:DNA processing protein